MTMVSASIISAAQAPNTGNAISNVPVTADAPPSCGAALATIVTGQRADGARKRALV